MGEGKGADHETAAHPLVLLQTLLTFPEDSFSMNPDASLKRNGGKEKVRTFAPLPQAEVRAQAGPTHLFGQGFGSRQVLGSPHS